jgi:hypothetical protein
MAKRNRLSPNRSSDNIKTSYRLRKFVRIIRHGQELPKACKRNRKPLRIDAIARSQIPMPESTAEYSLTNALSCG